MKGILLAGGSGTRLLPSTHVVNKHLLPVYDKPMIYYPLALLMQMGLREILIVSTPQDTPLFERLFGSGDRFGIHLDYAVQDRPRGLAHAFLAGRTFIGQDCTALALGDNILHGASFVEHLRMQAAAIERDGGAAIFVIRTPQAERGGVVEFADDGRILSYVEKPRIPRSDWIATGIYLYDGEAVERAAALRPSARGELEITDLNNSYLADGRLQAVRLPADCTWIDAGTHESLLQAAKFVCRTEQAEKRPLACLEEIAFRNGWISADTLRAAADLYGETAYGHHLTTLLSFSDKRA